MRAEGVPEKVERVRQSLAYDRGGCGRTCRNRLSPGGVRQASDAGGTAIDTTIFSGGSAVNSSGGNLDVVVRAGQAAAITVVRQQSSVAVLTGDRALRMAIDPFEQQRAHP